MNKVEILSAIVGEVAAAVQHALAAADEARATATDKENVAENRYDTLGLEAAYLAHGQSERVQQLKKDLDLFVSLQNHIRDDSIIEVGSLVRLESGSGESRFLFIGPARGGLVVNYESVAVTVITPDAPLGQALIGAQVGDEVTLDTKSGPASGFISDLW
jgi:transcription elongation GreA/GreB family factor